MRFLRSGGKRSDLDVLFTHDDNWQAVTVLDCCLVVCQSFVMKDVVGKVGQEGCRRPRIGRPRLLGRCGWRRGSC